MGKMRNAYKILDVKPGVEKSRHGWVNDIKRILKKWVRKVDGIYLVQVER
jgi:hypothetical protein